MRSRINLNLRRLGNVSQFKDGTKSCGESRAQMGAGFGRFDADQTAAPEEAECIVTALHPILNDLAGTLWCGPASVAAITGKPVSMVVDMYKAVSGRPVITYVWSSETRQVLNQFGYRLIEIPVPGSQSVRVRGYWAGGWREHGSHYRTSKPTLARWMHENREHFAEFPVLLSITGHACVLHAESFVDNQTLVPVHMRAVPRRNRRVREAYQVRRQP